MMKLDDSRRGNDLSNSEISAELTHITCEVAGDHRLKVTLGERGQGSYANINEGKIVLDPEHLSSQARARFVAAHEGAHIRDTPSYEQLEISDYGVEEIARKLGLLALKNVIEDCAINDRFVRDVPPLGPDALAFYERKDGELGWADHPEVRQAIAALGFVPRYAKGLAAILSDWSELRHNLGFAKSSAEYTKYPYQGAEPNDPDIEKFIKSVLPQTRSAIATVYSKGASGDEMLLAGKMRHYWCEKVLYPELAKLLEKDLEQLLEELPDSPGAGSAGPNSGGAKATPSEMKRKAKERLARFDDTLREALRGIADQQADAPSGEKVTIADNIKERVRESEQAAAKEFQQSGKELRDALLRSLSPYQQYYVEVADKVDEVYGRLVDVFVPRTHFSWKKKQPNGSKIDMVQAMHYEATGSGANELFMQRTDPQRQDISLVILVDRSTSMSRDERIKNAIRAAIFSVELSQRLGIACSVISFSDEQEMLVEFSEDIHDTVIQEKVMEGLNLKGGTFDAAALLYAEKQLQSQRLSRCLSRSAILMISDAGSSEETKLKDVVQKIEDRGVPIIYFGIGAETVDENSYYKRSFGGLLIDATDLEKNFFNVFAREMESLAEELL